MREFGYTPSIGLHESYILRAKHLAFPLFPPGLHHLCLCVTVKYYPLLPYISAVVVTTPDGAEFCNIFIFVLSAPFSILFLFLIFFRFNSLSPFPSLVALRGCFICNFFSFSTSTRKKSPKRITFKTSSS